MYNQVKVIKGKLIAIEYLRCYAVLTLVLWHLFYCPQQCWRLSQESFIGSWGGRFLYWTSSFFIPSANMPLFTFISGYIFAYLISKGKYSVFDVFFLKKVHRLFIPYIVLGTIICYTSFEADFASIGFKYMVYGAGSHMWYVLMLFWVFILSWFIVSYKLIILNRLLTLMSLLSPLFFSFFQIEHLPWGMHLTMRYYCYFSIAMEFYNMSLYKLLNVRNNAIVFGLLYVFFYCLIPITKSNLFAVTITPLKDVFFCLFMFSLSTILFSKKNKTCKFVGSISSYGFGIYVFHHWIGWNYYHLQWIINLLSYNYFLVVSISTILIFEVSYLLTKWSLLTKVGRYFLS